jgi:hypothetical protein
MDQRPMRVIIFGPDDDSMACANLMVYGHRITHHVGGYVWVEMADRCIRDHDGCLLLGRERPGQNPFYEPEHTLWSLLFRANGKPVWLKWEDVPTPDRQMH